MRRAAMAGILLAAAAYLPTSAGAQAPPAGVRVLPALPHAPVDSVKLRLQGAGQVAVPITRIAVEARLRALGMGAKVDMVRQRAVPGRIPRAPVHPPSSAMSGLLRSVTPFRVSEAWAQQTGTSGFLNAVILTDSVRSLTAGTHAAMVWSGTGGESAGVACYGTLITNYLPTSGYLWVGAAPSVADLDTRRSCVLTVYVGTSGWYYVGMKFYNYNPAPAGLDLRHYECTQSSCSLVPLTRFTFPVNASAWADYPDAVYLAAGWHQFYWYFAKGCATCEFAGLVGLFHIELENY